MHILIIGGTRFVGRYLVEMLRKHNRVTVFNRGNYQTQYPENVHFIRGDRNEPFQIKERFDVVIDMVAYNGMHTKNALENLKFDFFVHFGTAAAYRKSGLFPLTETSPLGDWPIWGAYNRDKVDCERVLAKSGIRYAALRPVYILGPHNYLDREHFIYSKIKSGATIDIPGSGEAIAQFVFAKEVAASLALLATEKIEGAFNCAGDEGITLNSLIEFMGQIVGKKPIIKHQPDSDGMKWKSEQFPFANENFFCSSAKLKKLGVSFIPLYDGMKTDYLHHYSQR